MKTLTLENRWLRLFACCLIFLIFNQYLLASMSDGKAILTAQQTWGAAGTIAKVRKYGDNNWTTQVGFQSPGCADPFTKVGVGFNTWDSAYAAMPDDKAIKGTYSGVRFLHATTPSDSTLPGTHTQIPGGLTATNIQFLLDGQAVGDVTPLVYSTDHTSWQVDVQWDSTMVPDGFHVLCAALIHTDGAVSLTNASMLVVKQ